MNPLEIAKDLVDRAFGNAQAFGRICTFDDLLAHPGIQSEEPFEEITIEEPGCEAVLPPVDRSVPAVAKGGRCPRQLSFPPHQPLGVGKGRLTS